MTAFVGWVGSALVIALFLPQLVRTWRHGSDGASLATPLMGAVCQATWCVYGVLRHDPVLIVCNAVSCCFAVAILARFGLDARRRTHFSQAEAEALLSADGAGVSLEP